ncbi:MAG: hypothetical protein IJJ66_08155, partial [Treponema sp.]|nr:hypothetical protein [Treponema sp.]
KRKSRRKNAKNLYYTSDGGGNSHNKPPRKSPFLFYIIIWSTEKSSTTSVYANQQYLPMQTNWKSGLGVTVVVKPKTDFHVQDTY